MTMPRTSKGRHVLTSMLPVFVIRLAPSPAAMPTAVAVSAEWDIEVASAPRLDPSDEAWVDTVPDSSTAMLFALRTMLLP